MRLGATSSLLPLLCAADRCEKPWNESPASSITSTRKGTCISGRHRGASYFAVPAKPMRSRLPGIWDGVSLYSIHGIESRWRLRRCLPREEILPPRSDRFRTAVSLGETDNLAKAGQWLTPRRPYFVSLQPVSDAALWIGSALYREEQEATGLWPGLDQLLKIRTQAAKYSPPYDVDSEKVANGLEDALMQHHFAFDISA